MDIVTNVCESSGVWYTERRREALSEPSSLFEEEQQSSQENRTCPSYRLRDCSFSLQNHFIYILSIYNARECLLSLIEYTFPWSPAFFDHHASPTSCSLDVDSRRCSREKKAIIILFATVFQSPSPLSSLVIKASQDLLRQQSMGFMLGHKPSKEGRAKFHERDRRRERLAVFAKWLTGSFMGSFMGK